jgi:hypothetical protein
MNLGRVKAGRLEEDLRKTSGRPQEDTTFLDLFG